MKICVSKLETRVKKLNDMVYKNRYTVIQFVQFVEIFLAVPKPPPMKESLKVCLKHRNTQGFANRSF